MLKALVIDPSRFQRSVLASVFVRRNVEVVMAESAAAGLQLLAETRYDILCFSLGLDDMRGTDFFREAKRLNLVGFFPSLMVSATPDKALFDEAISLGITDCFPKTDLAGLEQYVEQWESRTTRRLSGRVMLVEDSDTAANFLTEVMVGLGLSVVRFKTAEEAIASLAFEDYKIVVTDFVLEGMQTGLSVIRAVRGQKGRKSELPILALSSIDSVARRVEILRAGANDFVGKPVVAEELAARLSNLLMLRELFDRLEAQHELVKEMALRDRLTSLHNRHHLDAEMPRLMAEACEKNSPLSLVVVDIDHFKRVNDRYGHSRGDEVLVAVADILRGVCRGVQQLVRYGGEEFVLALPGATTIQAGLGAERLRERIAAAKPGGIPVTASFGISTLKPGESFDQLFSRADAALYEAKRGGRDQVVSA
ncbi:MAG: two-component system, cell cycle response regulator [Pseudomonadota bacterium]|nr:two-component system, cell cycle response regulator [Pseudomonadota bacterium]